MLLRELKNAQGKDWFANWNGRENPCTFRKVFLAFRHQARAIYGYQWLSCSTLLSIFDRKKLCRLTMLFHQGSLAFTLRTSHSHISFLLTNSLHCMLKLRNCSVFENQVFHDYTDYLVWLFLWKDYFMSIMIHSLNLVANDKPTIRRDFFCRKPAGHFFAYEFHIFV